MKDIPTPMLVAAAAIPRADGRFLLQLRRAEKQHGGLWEFPGGKVEPGETPENALIREIEEELAVRLDPAAIAPLAFATHSSGSNGRPVVILLYMCAEWSGEPVALDAEALGWYLPEELPLLPMPPLDIDLAKAIRMPN